MKQTQGNPGFIVGGGGGGGWGEHMQGWNLLRVLPSPLNKGIPSTVSSPTP